MSSTIDQVTQRRRGVGLIAHDVQLSAGGYTLIAPQTGGGMVYLVAMDGEVVHRWKLPVRPGRHAVILPNGNLGYNGSHAASEDRYSAWSMWHGGDFYEVTPDGEVVWRYEDPAHHHDAQWLPNGHLLYAACERVSAQFAANVPGGNSYAKEPVMYADVIREVDRNGKRVWEWRAADHLPPADYPIAAGFGRQHWPLINGLGVTSEGLVLMSLRTTSGIIAISRDSGAVVYAIRPPLVSHQHAPVALHNGNILAFDNGNERAARNPGDLILRWTRRSRALVADAWEQVEVPLAEDSESYDIQIIDGALVKRTLTSITTSVLYTAAQQTADWGTPLGPGQTLAIRIYQLSNRLGRGTPATVTLLF